jgi:hypothetical protein
LATPIIEKQATTRVTIANKTMSKIKPTGRANNSEKRANTGPNNAAKIENFTKEIKKARIPFSLSAQVSREALKLYHKMKINRKEESRI